MKLLLVLLITFVFPVSASSADDVAEIEALYHTWHRAVEQADIPLYVSVLAPDVRLLPPGAAPIVTAASYAAFLEPVFKSADYRIDVVTPPVIDVVGDMAVAEYEYVIHLEMKASAEAISEPGALTASRTRSRYFDVLLKDDAGQWKVWRHTWQVVRSE